MPSEQQEREAYPLQTERWEGTRTSVTPHQIVHRSQGPLFSQAQKEDQQAMVRREERAVARLLPFQT